jgi:hypothetical protein
MNYEYIMVRLRLITTYDQDTHNMKNHFEVQVYLNEVIPHQDHIFSL